MREARKQCTIIFKEGSIIKYIHWEMVKKQDKKEKIRDSLSICHLFTPTTINSCEMPFSTMPTSWQMSGIT